MGMKKHSSYHNREHCIPFELNLIVPNKATSDAIEEGRRIARDKSVPGYSNINDLKEALES